MTKKLDPLDSIENGFAIIKKKPIIFFISLIIPVLSYIYNYNLYSQAKTYSYLIRLIRSEYVYSSSNLSLNSILFSFIIFLITIFTSSLAIRIAYEKKIDILKAIKFVSSKYTVVLISSILFSLVVGLGLFALIIPGIFLLIKLYFYQYSIIIDNKGIITSLEKSWEITKDNLLRIFFLGVFLFLIQLFFVFISSLISFISIWMGILVYIIAGTFVSSLSLTSFVDAYIKLSKKR